MGILQIYVSHQRAEKRRATTEQQDGPGQKGKQEAVGATGIGALGHTECAEHKQEELQNLIITQKSKVRQIMSEVTAAT